MTARRFRHAFAIRSRMDKIDKEQPHLHYIYLALQNTVNIIATFQKSC